MFPIARGLIALTWIFTSILKAEGNPTRPAAYQPVLPFSSSVHPVPFWSDVFPLPPVSPQRKETLAQRMRKTLLDIKKAKTEESKAELSYQAALLMSQSEVEDKQILTFVEQSLTLSHSPDRQKQLKLLSILLKIQADDANKRAQAKQELEGLVPNLGRYSNLLSSLVEARSLAGYDRRGRKIRKPQAQYLAPLELVSRLCQNYNAPEQKALFQFSASLWSEAQKDLAPSIERPFRFDCYTKTPGFPAFVERLALSTLNKDPSAFDASIVLYQRVKEVLPKGQQALDISWRILELEQARALSKGEASAYEDSLRKGLKDFAGTPYAPKLTIAYLNWVRGQLTQILKLDPKSTTLVQTRQVWDRFRTSYPNASEAKAQTPLFIQVLLHFGFRDEAIEQWSLLASDPGMTLRVEYSEKALALASQKYSFDYANPFATAMSLESQDLELLQRLLSQRLSLGNFRQTPAWAYQLSLATVEAKNQRIPQAQKRVLSVLRSISSPKVFAEAYNLALKTSLQMEDWSQLESLSRTGRQKQLALSDEELATLGWDGILILSLDKQIQALAAKKEIALIPQKMEALLAVLGPSPKRNESLYRLAIFYRQAKDYEKTLATLRRLEAEQLIDASSKNGLREQGRLCLLRGEFSSSLRAYQKLMDINPDDPDAESIWGLLGDLQSVEQNHDKARSAYKKAFALTSEAAPRETLAYKVLRITQEQKNMNWLQEDLKDWSAFLDEQPRLRALYLSALYHHRMTQGELPPSDLRNSFSAEEQQLLVVADLLAWIDLRYARAEHQKHFEVLKRSLLEKQAYAFQQLTREYQSLHLDYMKACAQGAGNACSQATAALLEDSHRLRSLAQDLVLTETEANLRLERERFLAATETDEATLQKRMRELENMGPLDPRWRKVLAKDSSDSTVRWLWSQEGALSSLALFDISSQSKGSTP